MQNASNLLSAASGGRLMTAMPKAHMLDVLAIRRGLRQGEFQAYVQPKFDLSSNVVESLEVLARWLHPELGLLTPAAFIPTMIQGNLLDDLLCELLDQGLAGQIQLHDEGRYLGVAFNISLLQLANAKLLNRLMSRLRQHPLPLSSVTLEITEDGPAVASEVCLQNVIRLRQLGVHLSLDDYGTGHSSLFRLCQLPFDEIKLAGEFTRQLIQSSQHRSIARTTVLLAGELGMRLVVEGIETEEQRHCLVQKGVKIGQGYLFARPMSIGTLRQRFARYNNGFAP